MCCSINVVMRMHMSSDLIVCGGARFFAPCTPSRNISPRSSLNTLKLFLTQQKKKEASAKPLRRMVMVSKTGGHATKDTGANTYTVQWTLQQSNMIEVSPNPSE